MNKSLTLSLGIAAGLILAACAQTSEQDVPIEDRAGTAGKTVKTATAQGKDGAAKADGAATPGAVTTPSTATPGATTTASSTGAQKTEQVTTQGQPMLGGIEAQALPGTAAGAADAGRVVATEASAKKNPLRDPDSPLAKRIIPFDYNSSAIGEAYRPLVEAHAQYLKANAAARAILQGHTDERGSREYNLALGQRRAESVRQAMSLLGVPDERMEAVSLGEEKPLAEGHDESAWKENRRAEIHYQGE